MRKESGTKLVDGTGHRPHYSLRTLCRALRFAASNPCGNIQRSLYEVCVQSVWRGAWGVGMPWGGRHGDAGACSVCFSQTSPECFIPELSPNHPPFSTVVTRLKVVLCTNTAREVELCSWNKLASYYRRITTVVYICVFF